MGAANSNAIMHKIYTRLFFQYSNLLINFDRIRTIAVHNIVVKIADVARFDN